MRSLPRRCSAWRAVPEAVTEVRHWLIDRAKEAGAEPRALEAIGLAATEAAANAVVHAFNDRAGAGEIVVSAELVDHERLRVVIADDGTGLRPRPDSPGLGLGLPLIRHLTDEVEVITPPAGGTEIRMHFGLAA
jgi:serine/threonine-protein kinase RsbW